MKRAALFVSTLVFGVFVGGRPAFGCSSAGCPLVTQNPDGAKSKGSWTFDLSFRGMTQDQLIGGDPLAATATSALIDFENRRLLPGHHQDAVMRHRLFETSLTYGLTERLSLFVTVPLMNLRRHDQRDLQENFGLPHTVHGDAPAVGATLAPTATTHKQKGMGDAQFGFGYLAAGGSERSVFLRASLKAPTGSVTREDTYGFIDRPDLQPGSGSWDGTFSVQGQQRWRASEWSLFAGAYGRLNGQSERGYRFGHEMSLALGITRGRVTRVRPSLQVGYRVTFADRFLNRTVPSTGARAWTLTPGARIRAGAKASLYVYAKVPIATSVNGTQLGPQLDVLAGISRSF
jgi:hypothetical protein